MTSDPIAAYLARGGSITKCPPGYAAYGWTPQGPVGLASDVCAHTDPRAYVQRVRQEPKQKDTEVLREARIAALKIGQEVKKRQAQERRAQIARDWDDLKSVRKMAEKHSVGVKRMRALLNDAGVRFHGEYVRPKGQPKPKRKIHERDAKVVAMLQQTSKQVQDVADEFNLTPRTVRRIAAAAGLAARCSTRPVVDENTRKAIASAYTPDTTIQQVADRFGVSWDLAQRAVQKYGRKE